MIRERNFNAMSKFFDGYSDSELGVIIGFLSGVTENDVGHTKWVDGK